MGYGSWNDVPWYERAILNVGSGLESVGKKIGGFVGLDDYVSSSFTDTKNKIKSDIAQKGSSQGFDWGTFGKRSSGYKIYDALFNDHPNIDESTGSSFNMGANVKWRWRKSDEGVWRQCQYAAVCSRKWELSWKSPGSRA